MRKFILLLISVIAISCSPLKKYENLPEVLAWEKDIKQFELLDRSETYSPNAIMFAGSSSIRLWTSLEKDMAPYPVIQRGFGGSKLSDLAVYADRIFAPHPCKAIVIFIANDITGGDNDKEPAEVVRLYKDVLKTIRKSHPVTPVFWIAVTPTVSRWKVWPQIKVVNRMINELSDPKDNTYFIETEKAFLNESGLPIDEYFRSDKLHLTEKGYAVWKEIVFNALKKVVPVPKVEIIGHRGASFLAPENTVASANLAWELGADAVECDIYLSADNKIMVIHDGTTKRTTGESYTVKLTKAEILRGLDAGSFKDVKYKGEKIPFLEEIIQTVPAGKELVIEIKCGSEVLPFLNEIISRYEKERKFTFICFDFQTISDTKKTFPKNSCYWLCSNADLFEKTINLVPASGIEGVSLSYGLIEKKTAARLQGMNLELFTWTVDDPKEASRLISLGVKGITTNRPGWINEQIY
jgi:glycerophosphoryl diester phosphodiesterase